MRQISFCKMTGKRIPVRRWLRLGLLVCCIGFWSGPLVAQNVRMDISLKEASLKDIICTIRQQSDYNVVYSDADITAVKKQDVALNSVTVGQVLDQCLRNTGLKYDIVDKTIVIKRGEQGKAVAEKQQVIRGIVRDKEGGGRFPE